MGTDEHSLAWLMDLYEKQGGCLYKLAIMLGAGERTEPILERTLLALQRRERRIVDPIERVEYLEEFLLHEIRRVRGQINIPAADGGDEELLAALREMPRSDIELLVTSHHLNRFGPELARVMRWSVGRTNQHMEWALQTLRTKLRRKEHVEAISASLSEALAAAAKTIRWKPDDKMEDTLHRLAVVPTPGKVSAQRVVLASIAAVSIGIAGAFVVAKNDEAVISTPTAPPASAPEATADAAMTAVVKQLPVYYVGSNNDLLYREHRNLPASGDLPRMAIEAIMTLTPLDPDYISLWRGTVRDVKLEGNTLTVDLDKLAYEMHPAEYRVAIDQMVYAATEITGNPDLKVKFLSEGGPAPEGFSGDGYGRRGHAPLPGLWINSPRNQDRVDPGNVLITGVVQPNYDAPVVTITDVQTKTKVAETTVQTTQTENSEGWYAWSVMVRLPETGTYDVTVTASSAGTVSSENKVIKVG